MNDPHAARARLTRRGLLGAGAAMAAGGYGLFPRPVLADIPDQFDGTSFKLAAPDPNPKYGGVLRMGITNRVPHFDLHQSGTYNNLGSMGCLFDNLIRRDPRDGGKAVIPDLAHSWEIAKDRKTYTFYLRKGIPFHDGAELTSEDVKATFDRIVKPPQGISIPRSILFRAVSEVNAPDKYTIEFKLSEPRPPAFIMAAIASGWNVIVRKKTLEENNYNLRKVPNYPGTGPFKTVRRIENEIWVVEKNKDYWNKGLPYLDGIEFYNLVPFSPELGSGILSGRVDYGRVTDPVTFKKAQATKGMKVSSFNQSVIHATYTNTKKQPMADPRVRRAMHLALDRPTLIEAIKDVAPMQIGGFMYPFSDLATPKAELVKHTRLSGRPRRRREGSEGTDGGRRPSERHPGPGLSDPRSGQLSRLVAGDPGDAAADAEHHLQSALRGRIGVVRRHRQRAFRPGDRRGGIDAAGSVGLLQRLVPHRRAAELFILQQPEGRCADRSDRSRGRSRETAGADPARRRRSSSRIRRCCRWRGRRSTTSGTTTSRDCGRTTTSAPTTSAGRTPSGWTRPDKQRSATGRQRRQ